MLRHVLLRLAPVAALALALAALPAALAQEPPGLAMSQTTAFTYQGRLTDAGRPAEGSYDLRFTLFDAATAGQRLGQVATFEDVAVHGGFFAVQLDYGLVFLTGPIFVEVAVRDGASTGDFAPLSPRQQITAVPLAVLATQATQAYTAMSSGTAAGLQNRPVSSAAPATGQHLAWNGSQWAPAGPYAAGEGLTLTGSTFSLDAAFADKRYWQYFNGNGAAWLQAPLDQRLELYLYDQRALTLIPAAMEGISPSIVGGSGNTVVAHVYGAVIGGGGGYNEPNAVTDSYGVVGGGAANRAGDGNANPSSDRYATVGGGYNNRAMRLHSTVSGGINNIAGGDTASVGGGHQNIASGDHATIGGGTLNTASGSNTTVAGGDNNFASSENAAIGGGGGNKATARYTAIPGGVFNEAAGDYSFVAGRKAKNSNADHDGVFLFADGAGPDFFSEAAYEFAVRASGGVRLRTSANLSTGCNLAAGSGTWACTSDRNAKEAFALIDSRAVLDSLMSVPIATWRYKGTSATHIGPTAQDFAAAFGVGEDERTISMVDADGVALAAAQGLYTELQASNERVAKLEARLAAVESGGPQPFSAMLWFAIGAALGGVCVVAAGHGRRGGRP